MIVYSNVYSKGIIQYNLLINFIMIFYIRMTKTLRLVIGKKLKIYTKHFHVAKCHIYLLTY